MPSEVEIVNLALGRIGIDQYIEDLEDDNVRARAAKLLYPAVRDQVLEDFPWDFALRAVALAVVPGDVPPGWGMQYRYPADALRMHLVVSDFHFNPGAWAAGPIWNFEASPFAKTPYRVIKDIDAPPAKLVLTNIDGAFAWYTARETDPNQFSALFISALGWKLAAELALALRADPSLAVNAGNTYIGEVSRAQVLSLTQSPSGEPLQSPSVQARL